MTDTEYGAVIRTCRKALGMNQFQLAERTGVSRNAVAGWETGHSRPDLNTVPVLCEALGISLDAFFGTGNTRREEGNHILRLFFSLEERDREALVRQMEALSFGRETRRRKENREIRAPRYVTVFASDLDAAAGCGCALGETAGEQIYLLEDEETARADEVITVSGNSMEPTFFEGDRVLVMHTEQIRPGEIGIFLVDNEGYIKEYRKDGLHSHNPAYRTMKFSEGQSVRCVGRVIGKLKPGQIPDRDQLRLIEEAEQAGKRGQ